MAATTPWGGYRWGPQRLAERRGDRTARERGASGPGRHPHPVGLIGQNRSRRGGHGSEFFAIRPFQPGDRLRRVNWRTTLRTGEMHSVGTSAEEDSSVLILVDAVTDVGASGGLDGQASTLDVTVRAASALAAHHVRVGDRVGLRVLGRTGQVLGPGSGLRHQRRLQELLAQVQPGWPESLSTRRLRLRIGANSVVVVLSPLLTPDITTAMVTLTRRGLDVVCIDTLVARHAAGHGPRPAVGGTAGVAPPTARARDPAHRGRATRHPGRSLAWARNARRRAPPAGQALAAAPGGAAMSTTAGERRHVYPGPDQVVTRAAIVLGALTSIIAAQAAGTLLAGWFQGLLVALAVLVAVRPESTGGVVLLVGLAYVWSTVPDPLSPLVLLVAAGLVLVHVGALVAAQGPARMRLDRAQTARWVLRGGMLWVAAAVVWGLDLLADDLPGGRLAYAVGLTLLMLLAGVATWLLVPRTA